MCRITNGNKLQVSKHLIFAMTKRFIALFYNHFLLSITAYWGRDSSAAQAAAAASSQLFGSPFGAAAAGLGLLPGSGGSNNDRYSMNNHQHHQNTMAVAASQAASLAGLHPASKYNTFLVIIRITLVLFTDKLIKIITAIKRL